MAVFHLELEIDSAAQPELHRMLLAIVNPSARAERMRQLASTGLIWEHLRLASEPSIDRAGKGDTPTASKHLALVIAAKPAEHDARGLPVLRDEVPESSMPRRPDVERPPVAEALPFAEREKSGSTLAATAAATDAAPGVHMTGTRSRLMRMKNRGLFTNE